MARETSWRVPKRRLFSTPIPKETRTYKPVSHKNLASITVKAIKKAGFKLDSEEYYSTQEGQIATARYTIKDVRDDDMQLEIGWQNSYNKRLTVKFAIGTRIMICENGCVSGNFGAFAKKHMADIKTFAPEEIAKSILEASKVFDKIVLQKEIMKRHIIGKERQYELVGKLYLTNSYFSTAQINIVKEEMRKPTHDYKAEGSIWEIYQYVTFSMKDLHPTLWMDAHIQMHAFFLDEVDKNTKKLEIEEAARLWLSTIDVKESSEKILEVEEHKDEAQLDLLDVIKEVEEESFDDDDDDFDGIHIDDER